ncbi:neuromedin U receptor homolog nmur-2-like [Apostichopus japonicus]|uniref:neuromedin U receptor homolog nmur-2-like n=1 Tax=Stichopus japonicus TaxID=307972 RepID=UPI003AB1EB88
MTYSEEYSDEGGCANVTIEVLQTLEYTPAEHFTSGILMPILLIIGILDNVAFMVVVARLPAMRTPTNCYLVNLAIADVIFLVFAMGEKVWIYKQSPYSGDAVVFGEVFGCVIFPLLSDVSYFASLCFVTLVSFERFIAVCRPQNRNHFQRPLFIALMCIGSWTISTVLSATLIPGNILYEYYCFTLPDVPPYHTYPTEYATCGSRKQMWSIYTNGLQTLPFIVSLLLNIYLYVMIVKGLNQSIKRLRGHQGGKKDQDTRVRDQIARMLILNGVVFFVCLAPFEMTSIISMFQIPIEGNWLPNTGRVLSYFNSVVNPIIFTTMSQRYREAFKMTFLPQRCSKVDESSTTNGTAASTTTTYIKMTKAKA